MPSVAAISLKIAFTAIHKGEFKSVLSNGLLNSLFSELSQINLLVGNRKQKQGYSYIFKFTSGDASCLFKLPLFCSLFLNLHLCPASIREYSSRAKKTKTKVLVVNKIFIIIKNNSHITHFKSLLIRTRAHGNKKD